MHSFKRFLAGEIPHARCHSLITRSSHILAHTWRVCGSHAHRTYSLTRGAAEGGTFPRSTGSSRANRRQGLRWTAQAGSSRRRACRCTTQSGTTRRPRRSATCRRFCTMGSWPLRGLRWRRPSTGPSESIAVQPGWWTGPSRPYECVFSGSWQSLRPEQLPKENKYILLKTRVCYGHVLLISSQLLPVSGTRNLWRAS